MPPWTVKRTPSLLSCRTGFISRTIILRSGGIRLTSLFSQRAPIRGPPSRQMTRVIVRRAAEMVMAEQKKEVREGLEDAMTAMDVLQKVYGMEVTKLSDEEVQAFRDKTEPVYARWAVQIGTELVRSAEAIVGNVK